MNHTSFLYLARTLFEKTRKLNRRLYVEKDFDQDKSVSKANKSSGKIVTDDDIEEEFN